ncbi:MAG TPA: type I-E CRISPR-associated protein Cas7/Cse4/CasC [Anaerolineaceae bacterium]|nr:type I-E CRISPR-associated protein Cas7/Cse4/CasC [Anaerolineaceae bacterium]
MFLEVHILQSFAPSNLNRDDTGNPKDTEFGGARRARVSSQCIKRSIRMHPAFAEATAVERAVRTRWMTRLLVPLLVRAGKPDDQATKIAYAFATQYSDMKDNHNNVALYLSASEINDAVQALIEQWDTIVGGLKDNKSPALEALAKDLFKKVKNRTSAPDIALFGRMLAGKPEFNINAACQVAHAISTHRVTMEMDYYTAVDDLIDDDKSGAAMVGVIPFNSACFYRYARLDWDLLVRNLGGDLELAAKTVQGFLRATVLAVPTGKQTSFAAQNPPDFVLGVVRKDGQSWSLANAFEVPVRPAREGGLMSASIAALDAYWARLVGMYGSDSIQPVMLTLADQAILPNLSKHHVNHLDAWVQKLTGALPKE